MIRISYIVSFLILLFSVSSCKKVEVLDDRVPIARVNDTYLYKEDLKDLVPTETPKKDSINIVRNFINIWATKQLFIDQSKRNLTTSELSQFDELVEDYRSTLYINAYKDAVINKSINMEVTDTDIEQFYKENLENFNLNEELVKIRYLHLPPDFNDIVATQTHFNRFNEEDEEYLRNKKLEFVNFSFEDSKWVGLDEVLNTLPVLKKQKRANFLREGKYLQIRDSLGVYMFKIQEVLRERQTAPLEYVKPTVRQIILSKRKRELIKKLEKDITKDAIENKQFEIFD